MDPRLPTSKRALLFGLGIACLAGTMYGTAAYRPYARSHGVHDFGFSESLPSFGGTVTGILLLTSIFARDFKTARHFAIGLVIGNVLYEIMQPMLRTGVFDWIDVMYVFLGGAAGWLALISILRDRQPLLRSNPSLERP
jgi:hypothetical protein